MADATTPAPAIYMGGHAPFWMKVRHVTKTPGGVVKLVGVEDGFVTFVDEGVTEVLWTHRPAARVLEAAFASGVTHMARFGSDIFLADGYPFELVDPTHASPCRSPKSCDSRRVSGLLLGIPGPWQVDVSTGWSPGN